MDTVYHLSFVALFVIFTGIRMAYHRLAQKTAGPVTYHEGRLHRGLRLVVGVPFMLAFVGYWFRPDLFAWARLPLPAWSQALGLVLAAASLPAIAWVHSALGANFSTVLHTRAEHTLVTHGPYRWVRHPMYTLLFIFETGLLLLTQNAFIGGTLLIALALIVITRLPREEAMLAERFGPAYTRYQQRTGRLLPRL
jgi:protein-S-isoprenylcysteine O-methyltransferase Ste14